MDRGGWLARLCVASRRVLMHVAVSREAHSSNNADFSRVTRLTSPSRPHCPLPERSAGAMLSSKPPPYDSALVVEARESAGKIEGGFWTKSSSAADYESRARKKLETISGQIQRSGTPGETQRAHYEAAMTAQVTLLQASAPPPPPPPQDNAQLAATLDLFDRKLQSSGAGASAASQASSPRPAADPALNRIVQAIVKRYVDRAEFKAFLQTLSMDQRRAYLVKIAQCGKRALAHYYQQQRASASKSKGLGEVALVEHITGVVMKLMAKASGDGAAAASLGLHHQQQLRQREEETARAAAAREKLERERAEHERARRDGAGVSVEAPFAGGVMEMAAYWTRLGEMRGAYLPRAKQTMELLKKKARSGADDSTQKKNAERFLQWMSAHLVPMLSQTAEAPCASAKFCMAELEQLDAQMKKLIAVTSGRAAAAQGSAAGGGAATLAARLENDAGGFPAASGVVAESSVTSESVDHGDGSKRRKSDEGLNPKPSRDQTAIALEREARENEARADARRKAAEALSARPSAFARVMLRDATSASHTAPPTPFALERFPPPKTPGTGKPGDGSGDDVAPPALFVDPARKNAVVAMSFVNGGRELRRRALETKFGAGDATSETVWKSWDDLVK